MKGFVIIPELMRKQITSWKDDFLEFACQYKNDLPNERILKAEMDIWETYWLKKHVGVIPDRVSTTLKMMKDICCSFPSIVICLKLIGTVPVTTCECERSVLSLRRLKTYLRNTMNQERVNVLALMHAHREIELDNKQIIDMFARLHPRHLKLQDILSSDYCRT